MTSKPQYRALFFGAGDEMQCGVGQFTRLLGETIEKIDPGSNTTLTLTRGLKPLLVYIGSFIRGEIGRASCREIV